MPSATEPDRQRTRDREEERQSQTERQRQRERETLTATTWSSYTTKKNQKKRDLSLHHMVELHDEIAYGQPSFVIDHGHLVE